MRIVALSMVTVLAVACGAGTQPLAGFSSSPDEVGRPPDLVVAAGGDELVLSPFAYCWWSGNQVVCADGVPPDPLPSLTVDDGENLAVEFPLDWELQANLLPGGDYCEESFIVDVDAGGPPVEALGPAGTYRVEVFGQGDPGSGDWAFELTTTEDSPSPSRYFQVLWNPSGRDLDPEASFLVAVGNLTSKPQDVSAVATVMSSNGASADFELIARLDEDCWSSAVGFEAPENLTSQVLALGPAPYDVELRVTIDGQQIIAPVITWPEDFPSNSNESPRVSLDQ